MKYMKYIVAVIVVIAAAFAVLKLTEVKRAEHTFAMAMEALKEGDIVKTSSYVKGGKIIDEEIAEKFKGGEALLKILFSNMTYSINNSEKIDDETIKINADITTINMQKIFADSLREILALHLKNAFTFGENKLDDEQLNTETIKIITDKMNSDSAETITKTIDINVVSSGIGWKIDAVDSVKDAVTGGLISAVQDLSKALG